MKSLDIMDCIFNFLIPLEFSLAEGTTGSRFILKNLTFKPVVKNWAKTKNKFLNFLMEKESEILQYCNI
jgi:hypothetical protein